ncbi:MAG: family oxidoreductase [Bacteroidetes bacterium]|nr:family oxidoreductase [Bacteroidota bacterium]
MNEKKSPKIALITGGSRGLGKDMALKIAQRGNNIIITYNSKKAEAEDVIRQLKELGVEAEALQLNTGNISGLNAFAVTLSEMLGKTFNAERIDYLVNNAGTSLDATALADVTEQQLDNLLSVNFKGVFFLTQRLLPLLNDGGGIVNISSGLARFTVPGSGAYASLKSAIETLTRYQAKEFGSRGIRCNFVAPGAVATDFSGGHLRDNPQVQEFVKSVTALQRIATPDDIGGVVAFLCSDDAKWVTAQRIEASGGMFL